MNERQLEYVVAIVETGSFTAAAERCHTTQSALSHQVARLERHLGTQLFDRTGRSVQLTTTGRSLLPVARQILRDMRDVRAEIRAVDGLIRGPLRIGMTQTAIQVLNLLQLLTDYGKAYPDVEMSITVGPGFELLSGVQSGHLDIGFGALDRPALPPGVRFVPVGRIEPLVAVVASGHPLASRTSVQLRQLAQTSQFIDFRAHTTLWNKVEAMFGAAGVERRVMCELGSIPLMVGLAATGLAVAVVPRAFTEVGGGQPSWCKEIRVLPLTEPDSSLTMGFFCRNGTMATPLRAFAELFSVERHVFPPPSGDVLGG
ncbi:MAG TPA: LysR family transcriptional regulator [Streptosporangiaceae bacterium]